MAKKRKHRDISQDAAAADADARSVCSEDSLTTALNKSVARVMEDVHGLPQDIDEVGSQENEFTDTEDPQPPFKRPASKGQGRGRGRSPFQSLEEQLRQHKNIDAAVPAAKGKAQAKAKAKANASTAPKPEAKPKATRSRKRTAPVAEVSISALLQQK